MSDVIECKCCGFRMEDKSAKRIEELEAVLRELPCLEPFTCGRGDYLCMSCELGEANEY